MNQQAAVILAAGKGMRMRSAVPKVLHRICGKEMVALVVEAAEAAGLGPTHVVVGPGSSGIAEVLGPGVGYVEQAEQLGSGHALLQARSWLDGAAHVAVLVGDSPLVLPETLRRDDAASPGR